MSAATLEPAQKVQSVVSVGGHEIGYPHGHLGHLNASEENALHSFKLFLEEKGDYQSGPPPSHDDQTLVRFLRARRWVVADAYKQFKDTEDWRAANHLDILYKTIDLTAYEESRRLYPQWTGRRDKRGIPLYLFEIRHLDSKTVATYEKNAEKTYSKAQTDGTTPVKLLPLFALYENLTSYAHPLCTQMPDREHSHVPITMTTNIVDVTGVSLRQFWNLKTHMQNASQLATAHYPETLDRIFIIGAPYFFTTVWGWIKRWFDPITVSKIFILSAAEVKPTLESFIDPKNIPKQYGGELEFNWGNMPKQDPAIRERVSWENGFQDFPGGPMYWTAVNDGKDLECIAVGSDNQVERHVRVCTIPKTYPPAPPTAPDAVAAVEEVKQEEAPKAAESVASEPVAQSTSTNGAAKQEATPAAVDTQVIEAVEDLTITDVKKPAAPAEISEKVLEAAQETPKTTAAPTTAVSS